MWFQVTKDDDVIFTGNSSLQGPLDLAGSAHVVSCVIPRLPLFAGRYELRLFAMVDGRRADYLEHALEFHVDDAHFLYRQDPRRKGGVLVDQSWRIVASD